MNNFIFEKFFQLTNKILKISISIVFFFLFGLNAVFSQNTEGLQTGISPFKPNCFFENEPIIASNICGDKCVAALSCLALMRGGEEFPDTYGYNQLVVDTKGFFEFIKIYSRYNETDKTIQELSLTQQTITKTSNELGLAEGVPVPPYVEPNVPSVTIEVKKTQKIPVICDKKFCPGGNNFDPYACAYEHFSRNQN